MDHKPAVFFSICATAAPWLSQAARNAGATLLQQQCYRRATGSQRARQRPTTAFNTSETTSPEPQRRNSNMMAPQSARNRQTVCGGAVQWRRDGATHSKRRKREVLLITVKIACFTALLGRWGTRITSDRCDAPGRKRAIGFPQFDAPGFSKRADPAPSRLPTLPSCPNSCSCYASLRFALATSRHCARTVSLPPA